MSDTLFIDLNDLFFYVQLKLYQKYSSIDIYYIYHPTPIGYTVHNYLYKITVFLLNWEHFVKFVLSSIFSVVKS